VYVDVSILLCGGGVHLCKEIQMYLCIGEGFYLCASIFVLGRGCSCMRV